MFVFSSGDALPPVINKYYNYFEFTLIFDLFQTINATRIVINSSLDNS